VQKAAFALMNVVRPLGRSTLGLSAGLLGTGMAVRAPLMGDERFDPASLVEDADLHLRLVRAGHRVVFAPDAAVLSPMPADAATAHAQHARWHGGWTGLVRSHLLPLLSRGARHRDPAALAAAADLLVPPTSILAPAHTAVLLASVATRSGVRPALALNATFALYVLVGLKVAGEPWSTFRALAGTPRLVVRKAGVFGRLAARGAPATWQRTGRDASA
jgi:hypothetical protein